MTRRRNNEERKSTDRQRMKRRKRWKEREEKITCQGRYEEYTAGRKREEEKICMTDT